MDLQTLIVIIAVVLAAAFVLRTFARQFTSRGQKGCASCSHGGSGGQSGAPGNDELIQVESIREER